MTLTVKQMIAEMPVGLDRVLLRILSYHVGFDAAISRKRLLCELNNNGFKMKDDRPARLCINQLRKKGVPICSSGGDGGGYWLAANNAELDEFISHELHPRAMDLLEQEKAMRDASNCPPELQASFL